MTAYTTDANTRGHVDVHRFGSLLVATSYGRLVAVAVAGNPGGTMMLVQAARKPAVLALPAPSPVSPRLTPAQSKRRLVRQLARMRSELGDRP